MKISARLYNSPGKHTVLVSTESNEKQISIPPKKEGLGSSINGGELLFLAIATCYCNDLYREAGRRGITIQNLEVEVQGDFGKEGEPASNIIYHVKLDAPGIGQSDINALILDVDKVAEIHNTIRQGIEVKLVNAD